MLILTQRKKYLLKKFFPSMSKKKRELYIYNWRIKNVEHDMELYAIAIGFFCNRW